MALPVRPLAGLALSVLAVTPAAAARVDASARTALALTLYQNGPALVDETRTIDLDDGTTMLSWTDMARGALPGSIDLSPVEDGAFAVRTQRYRPATVDHMQMLRAFVGREVIVQRFVGDDEKRETAKVLRADPTPVLEIAGEIHTGMPGYVIFKELPEDMPLTPTLEATLSGTAEGEAPATLRYLTEGLSWQADHVLALAEDGKTVALRTKATFHNSTNRTWSDVDLSLIAGSPNQAGNGPVLHKGMMRAEAMAAAPAADRAPGRSTVTGYHLYHLPAPVTLEADGTKQVTLLTADGIRSELLFTVQGPAYGPVQHREGDRQPATMHLTFVNDEASGPGQPLPAGTVRVYAEGGAGARFLGADTLSATPVGQEVDLTLGQAFDVTARGRQTDINRVSDKVSEAAYEVVLANARQTDVTVRVAETLHGDWTILEESADHEKVDAATARWTVTVPAGGETTLTYTVRTRR